jgi:hypothetical protein
MIKIQLTICLSANKNYVMSGRKNTKIVAIRKEHFTATQFIPLISFKYLCVTQKIGKNMLLSLIKHSWLGFARSDFFRKSIAVQGIVIFTIFIIGVYVIGFAKRLPGILLENFPQRQPGEWVYSFLVFIMIIELLSRFLSQKLPMNYIKPYLHLPVPWQVPSFYWLIRAFFHPMNFFLLFFFIPFIGQTINPEIMRQDMGVLGVFLVILLNHSIYICMKTSVGKKKITGRIIGSLILLILILSVLQTEKVMQFSLNLFLGFVKGDTMAFFSMAALIMGFHIIAFFNLKEKLFYIEDKNNSAKAMSTSTLANRIAQFHPLYGKYWWLEWQLVTRNKRSRLNFWLIPVFSIGFVIYIILSDITNYGAFGVIFFLIAGGYGATHLQNTLSWESHFFDFIATRDFSLEDFLQAKYYFYVFLSSLQFALFVPLLAIYDTSLLILCSGLFVYVCGVGYFAMFRLGINNSGRFDPNGSASFNLEGLSGTKYLIILGMYLSIIPFFILDYFIKFPHSGIWLMIITGLAMIVCHKIWIKGIANRLLKQKYRNLAIYRNK